jgi:hypothetical protein
MPPLVLMYCMALSAKKVHGSQITDRGSRVIVSKNAFHFKLLWSAAFAVMAGLCYCRGNGMIGRCQAHGMPIKLSRAPDLQKVMT